MCKKQHRDVFFAFNGPGPYACAFCPNEVSAWWDADGDGREPSALVIHHADGDHDNNHPENLVAAHYGCHTAHHKSLMPLVAAGSTLPPRWRERIASGTAKRMADMSDEERAGWNALVREGMSKIDKSPAACACGAGPFRGAHGLGIHQARSKCAL